MRCELLSAKEQRIATLVPEAKYRSSIFLPGNQAKLREA
jgi:hypothetical protein